MFLNLVIKVYTPQHVEATVKELERLGYKCVLDTSSELYPADFIVVEDTGDYKIRSAFIPLEESTYSYDPDFTKVKTRQLRKLHRVARTTVSQDALSSLEVVPKPDVDLQELTAQRPEPVAYRGFIAKLVVLWAVLVSGVKRLFNYIK